MSGRGLPPLGGGGRWWGTEVRGLLPPCHAPGAHVYPRAMSSGGPDRERDSEQTLNKYLILAGGHPEAGWAGVTLRGGESEPTEDGGGPSATSAGGVGLAGGATFCTTAPPPNPVRAPVALSATGSAPSAPADVRDKGPEPGTTTGPRSLPGGDPCGSLSEVRSGPTRPCFCSLGGLASSPAVCLCARHWTQDGVLACGTHTPVPVLPPGAEAAGDPWDSGRTECVLCPGPGPAQCHP